MDVAHCSVNGAAAKIVMPQVTPSRRSGVRQKRRACIQVDEPFVAERRAKREIDLIAKRVFAKASLCVTGWQNEAQSGGESTKNLFVVVSLIAIVEQDVADAIIGPAAAAHEAVGHRIAELVRLTEHRSFLGESEIPTLVVGFIHLVQAVSGR